MTLLLVDGPNLMMRSLHAANGANMSAGGVATGGLVLFINGLSKHIKAENPTHVVVVWEGYEGNAARKKLLPSYKAERAQAAKLDGQPAAFSMAHDFLDRAGIQQRSKPYVEADDTIAAYWAHATRHHVDKIVILSSDKDMLQLVGDNPRRVPTEQVRLSSYGVPTDRWDAARVQEHYGVPPSALAALLAVMGDKSDGIEGVPGIGPKKGAKLLVQHDLSLSAAFPPGHDYRERVLINHNLVNLRELDLYEMPPMPFRPVGPDSPGWSELVDFCQLYELTQVQDRLLTGEIWKGAQDAPKGRLLNGRPAQTTAQRA